MENENTVEVVAKKKKGIVGKIVADLKENTKTVHEINKQNIANIKKSNRENNPELSEFVHSKGIKNKAKAAVKGLKSSVKKNSVKEAERRKEIKSYSNYAKALEKSR